MGIQLKTPAQIAKLREANLVVSDVLDALEAKYPTLRGVVRDSQGLPLPTAHVRLSKRLTSLERTTTTTDHDLVVPVLVMPARPGPLPVLPRRNSPAQQAST